MTEYKIDILVNGDSYHVTRSIIYIDSFKYLKHCIVDLISEDELNCSFSIYKIENNVEIPISLDELF